MSDFRAESIRIGGIENAITQTLDSQLVFRDSDVPFGVKLVDLTFNNLQQQFDSYSVEISGQIYENVIDAFSIYLGSVAVLQPQITEISGSAAYINEENVFQLDNHFQQNLGVSGWLGVNLSGQSPTPEFPFHMYNRPKGSPTSTIYIAGSNSKTLKCDDGFPSDLLSISNDIVDPVMDLIMFGLEFV